MAWSATESPALVAEVTQGAPVVGALIAMSTALSARLSLAREDVAYAAERKIGSWKGVAIGDFDDATDDMVNPLSHLVVQPGMVCSDDHERATTLMGEVSQAVACRCDTAACALLAVNRSRVGYNAVCGGGVRLGRRTHCTRAQSVGGSVLRAVDDK